MPGRNRVLCANSGGRPDEIRHNYGERWAYCRNCDRILKPRKNNTLRAHSIKGKNTRSLDQLYLGFFLDGEKET